VASIERSLNSVPGTKVTGNASVPERVTGQPRQVDVFVEIPTGRRLLRVGIEVRDKSAPLDLPEVEQLVAKLSKLDLDYGCIVASSGFTASAEREAARNGIEVRTLQEIEKPDWWRAEHIHLQHRRIELLESRINFRTEDLAIAQELLAGTDGTQVEVILNDGRSDRLSSFIAAQGATAVDRPELSELRDQDVFKVRIEFEGSAVKELRSPSGQLPLPVNVQAQYRLHRELERVALTAFNAADGVLALAGVSEGLGKQITVVVKEAEDGSKRLSLSFENVSDKPTPIAPRSK